MSNLIYRDKAQNSESDTGVDVRHVQDGESLSEAVLKRASSNLERRTVDIQEYLSEEQELRRSYQSRNMSLIDVNVDGSVRAPGMLRILRSGGSYFVLPGHIRGDEAQRDYRILVVSGIDGKGTYCLKREALYSFYTDESNANYNTAMGLTSAGDTICLRVPRRPEEEVAASTRDLVQSSSKAKDFKSAVVTTDIATLILDESLDASKTGALVKSPAKTLISIVFDQNATDMAGLETYVQDYMPTLSLTVTIGEQDYVYTLDHRESAYDAITRTLQVYTADYRAVDEQYLQGAIQITGDSFTSSFTSSEVTLTTSRGSTDPYSELIPLFYHAGDRIVVTGVGSVLISTIDHIDSLGFPILISGDGRTISTYTQGQVSRITTQVSVQVPNVVSTHVHEEDLFYDSTLVDSGYVVDSIDIVEVSGSASSDFLVIHYLQASGGKITLLSTSGVLDLSEIPGSKVSVGPLKVLDAARVDSTIQTGEKLLFSFDSSDSPNPTTGLTLIARINYVERIEHP